MTSTTAIRTHDHAGDGGPVQLSLIPNDQVPIRFRLDAATVRRGRRHIAEIRQMLRTQAHPDAEAPPPLPRREPDHPERHAA